MWPIDMFNKRGAANQEQADNHCRLRGESH